MGTPLRGAPVIHTTGAGDAFVGVLAAALAAGDPLDKAVAAANAAGAMSVLQRGARAGMPTQAELTAFLAGPLVLGFAHGRLPVVQSWAADSDVGRHPLGTTAYNFQSPGMPFNS
jgi:hypothetical protein